MTSYTSLLKSWGATGTEFPDGYKYEYQIPPVDEYDNFVTHHLIKDVTHLVDLTNGRLDTNMGSEPNSPANGHLWVDGFSDPFRLNVYDSTNGGFQSVAYLDELNAHLNDTGNPHGVSAAQAGAIRDAPNEVHISHLDFDVATQQELNTHRNQVNNPHNVTAAQVDSYTKATSDDRYLRNDRHVADKNDLGQWSSYKINGTKSGAYSEVLSLNNRRIILSFQYRGEKGDDKIRVTVDGTSFVYNTDRDIVTLPPIEVESSFKVETWGYSGNPVGNGSFTSKRY